MADPIGSISGLASGIQWRDLIDQIMQAETQRRLTPLQTQAAAQLSRKNAWASLNTLLGKFSDASKGLADGSAFGQFKVAAQNSPTSGRALFGASASATAGAGTYSVEVRALARQEKLRANVVSDSSAALGYTGTFTVNGKSVDVSASDSLTAIRDRINAANGGSAASGVTASIVDVSATEHYLTLTADATGADGIRLTDGGGVLQSLGVSTGSQSAQLASDTTPIAAALGLSPQPQVRTIVVDGHEVTVDLGTDTFQSLMQKINDAGGSATVVSGTDSGGSPVYSLAVQGDVWGKGDDADSAAVLSALGFTRSNQITAGADARVRIDGLDVVRSGNTISDALAGVTLDLKEAEPGQTLNLTLTRDVDAAVKKVQDFATAFNAIVDFQNQQRQSGAPLFGNSAIRAITGSLKDVLLSDVEGVASGDLTRLGLAGVALTKDGTLAVDADKLKSTLSSSFTQVQNLFATRGTASGSGISFVTGTSSTATGDHAVSISHAATTAAHTGNGAAASWDGVYHAGSGIANRMSVQDEYSGKTVEIDLVEGQTAAQIATALQSAFSANGLALQASTSGNDLVIGGTKYGSNAAYTVSYSEYDSGSGTTLGSDLATPIYFDAGSYAGTDVVGTIDGVEATGAGQILTGISGSDAEGLSVQYTGTTDVASGSATYSLGAGGLMQRILDGYTRGGDGLIALNSDAIDRSVTALEQRQSDVQSSLDRYQASLVSQYTAMEAAMSRIQSQGNWLTNQIASMNKSSA
jgi:flagellar hook-associated protein 2